MGVDIAKLSGDLPLLLISISIDALAMVFIVLGVRGVALEVWPFVLAFDVAIIVVTVGHGITFCFRHTGLNAANFFFDASLAKLAILYTVMLARFERLKPADYDARLRAAAAAGGGASFVSGAGSDNKGDVTGILNPGEADLLTSDGAGVTTEITGAGQTGNLCGHAIIIRFIS